MKKFLFPAILCTSILCTAFLSGCANKSDESAYFSYEDSYRSDINGGYYAAETTAASAAESYDSYEYYGDAEVSQSAAAAEGGGNSTLAAESIQKEMLVYSCYMTVDTLEFDASMNSFKNTLDTYGGFVETENYSDGGGGGRWYSENEQKWQSYSATVRIPCKNYEAFCSSAGNLGDLRSKTSNVENLSQEYSDLSTTLEIYEAKEQRYIALLAEVTEDEYAVEIERELTEIQVKIAEIKTRMNRISTDVAYSYVYFTLNEVKEYAAEPVKTDTFFDRLGYTLSDAGETFLDFLEELLFFLIYAIPYLILIGIAVFVIVIIAKKIKKRKIKKVRMNTVDEEKKTDKEITDGKNNQ